MSQKLKEILGLDAILVAAKIVKTERSLPDIKLPTQNNRYCQLLMLARKGQNFNLKRRKIRCSFKKEGVFSPPKSRIIRKRR